MNPKTKPSAAAKRAAGKVLNYCGVHACNSERDLIAEIINEEFNELREAVKVLLQCQEANLKRATPSTMADVLEAKRQLSKALSRTEGGE